MPAAYPVPVAIAAWALLFATAQCSHGAEQKEAGSSLRRAPFAQRERSLESAAIDACLSDELEVHERQRCRFFAIMIDAGSTGTRISVNEFGHEANSTCAGAFALERETHVELKPGLSTFADEPERVGDKIGELLEAALSAVPPALRPHTPIALRATAGLRLLPDGKAEGILAQARLALSRSPFLLSDDVSDSVSILSGTDEGIFGWFTLNFLLDRLKAVLSDPNELVLAVRERWTAAALDLGGGSTQVTFRPLQSKSISESPEEHLHVVSIFEQAVTLYSRSYLRAGIISARKAILNQSTRPTAKAISNRELFTGCMPPDMALRWNGTGGSTEAQFIVRGAKHYSAESCERQVRRFVKEVLRPHAPAELQERELYAFSYFYDRALQANLISSDRGGWIPISAYRKAARVACARRKADMGSEHWRPWQCLDLTYIFVLLTDGYGLHDDKIIFLAKKMRGIEVSWALGGAYHLLNTYHQRAMEQKRAKVDADRYSDLSPFYRFVDGVYCKMRDLLEAFRLA